MNSEYFTPTELERKLPEALAGAGSTSTFIITDFEELSKAQMLRFAK